MTPVDDSIISIYHGGGNLFDHLSFNQY